MLKKGLFVVLALILLSLPIAIRWFYYYEGKYEPADVARPDLTQIKAPNSEVEPFEDRLSTQAPGSILVDLSHSNRVEMAELGVLQARLTARGQRVEPVTAPDELGTQLRYAKALIVISPGTDWTGDEMELAREFVDKGGRLLLVTDPTRYAVEYDEWDYPVLDGDTPHINDLASQFGLLFQDDYLYNTVDNAGNFRNIKLDDFAQHDLTKGLDQVVFYAAHSIVTEEPALISAGGETQSSDSQRDQELTVALLAGNGAVLALGDLTFMTEPYNAAYDNDRLIANIADFLSSGERQYDLADFPFFFDDQVVLVYAGDPVLDSDLLQGGSSLQGLFAKRDRELTVHERDDQASDTIFFGLYQEAEEVEPYLTAAQITLFITPTQALEPPAPVATAPPEHEQTVVPTPEATASPAITVTAEISPSVQNRIQIESLGEMVLTGTLLLMHQNDGDRQVMVVLADTEKGLGNAIERLTTGNLEGCLLRTTETPAATSLALCPTGEAAPGDGGGGWQAPKPAPPTPGPTPSITNTITPLTDTTEPVEPARGVGNRILVIALDEGKGHYTGLTSVDDYLDILEGRYDVGIWSEASDGALDPADLLQYDLVILTAGDFENAIDQEESELILSLMLEEIPVIVSGAYLSDIETLSVQQDVQVKDASHPVAKGFTTGEIVSFVPGPSSDVYEIGLLETVAPEDSIVIFVRGPESEEAGAISVFVVDDPSVGVQVAFIGFPIYLLPQEVRTRLVLNTVTWMLNR